ncbi:hypothetical protein J6590_081028 [Homalodisca vitripennis]|nr:hypothetical protein J6590_081028 [Homalodisca vitripennis]
MALEHIRWVEELEISEVLAAGTKGGRTDATRCRKGFTSLPHRSSRLQSPRSVYIWRHYTLALHRELKTFLGGVRACSVAIYTQTAGTAGGRTDATRCRKGFTSLPDHLMVTCVDTYTSVAALCSPFAN